MPVVDIIINNIISGWQQSAGTGNAQFNMRPSRFIMFEKLATG